MNQTRKSSMPYSGQTNTKEDVIEIVEEDPFESKRSNERKEEKEQQHQGSSIETELFSFLTCIHRDLGNVQKNINQTTEDNNLELEEVESELNSFLKYLHRDLKTNSSLTTDVFEQETSLTPITSITDEIDSIPINDHDQENTTVPTEFLNYLDDNDDFEWKEDEIPDSPPQKSTVQTPPDSNIPLRRIRTKENELQCFFCRKMFPTKIQRQNHEKNTHPKSKVMCDICGIFTNLRRLKVHKKKHLDVRKFQCDKCPKCFKDANDLKRHQNDTHDDTTDCVCDHCGKRLGCKKTMRKHMVQYHLSHLAMKCSECQRPFGDKARLKRHMNVHKRARGEFIEVKKTEECDICNKMFTTKTHLKQHMGVHTGVRGFKCRFCSVGFNFLSSCRNHEKNVHGNSKRQSKKKKISPETPIVEEQKSLPTQKPLVLQKEVSLILPSTTTLLINADDLQQHQTLKLIKQNPQDVIFGKNILLATDGTKYYTITPINDL